MRSKCAVRRVRGRLRRALAAEGRRAPASLMSEVTIAASYWPPDRNFRPSRLALPNFRLFADGMAKQLLGDRHGSRGAMVGVRLL